MKDYYRERAPVYDRVYAYPERQTDLAYLATQLPPIFSGRRVLEVAAGTGHWTEIISSKALHITATDATEAALTQIQHRNLQCEVSCQLADAYNLASVPGDFNAAFAGLWYSHVPRERTQAFLMNLHDKLPSGAPVVFIDNSEAQCERLPITHTDDAGNTWQDRTLDDGSVHRVLKNFPLETELAEAISTFGTDLKYEKLDHFWWIRYNSR